MRIVAQHDDEDAFHGFVVARSAALARTAYLLTGDHHLAEDLVQTALFKAAQGPGAASRGDPEPYVRRILYTENVSWWRRRRHTDRDGAGGLRWPRAVTADDDLRLTLQRALGQLTAKQRTVLVLRYYEDLYRGADRRGCSASAWGTVKSTTRQALARLRVVAPHLGDLVGAAR